MSKKFFYGVLNADYVVEMVSSVCDTMSTSGNDIYAKAMLIETAAAETLLGTYEDPTPYGAGASLFQIDKPTFLWLRGKFINHPTQKKLIDQYGVDISQVQYSEIRNNPMLAAMFCRMRYMCVSELIPSTMQERSAYWKVYYNSVRGAGDDQGYINKNLSCDTASLMRSHNIPY